MNAVSPILPSPPVLSVRDLCVDIGTGSGALRIVDGVSFDIGRGETLALVGESGSGKSMVALSLMRLLPRPAGRLAAGEIRLDGEDLPALAESGMRKVRGSRIAMIFQDPLSALNPVQRVGDQIAEMFRLHRGMRGAQALAAATALLGRVGIPDAALRARDYPFQFSGGMRQRVMVAMAIALDPDLLIADEPTTALDATVQAQIIALLMDLQRERGMALLFISHDLAVVAGIAHRIGVLYAGRLAEYGPVREIIERPAHPYTKALLASIPPSDRRVGRLPTIGGSPPGPLDRVEGCPFRPRCALAVAACATMPALRQVAGGTRLAACHRAEEVTGS